ncbi:MAG: hypothetical protein HeimC2_34310 [Candidatus Heimdallarchaeota archaeon LC_2]|nr:MAG: hypothetical protein HeimC2_34310 [Candidatus Heimdallarchaeota archaeon LC_2]
MTEKKEYNTPKWLNKIDRNIFNSIKPVFNLYFDLNSRYPYNPETFSADESREITISQGGGDESVFIFDSSNQSSKFKLSNYNEKHAVRALNPHIFSEIAHLYDISKIAKFKIESTNVISFVSPELFQPIKDNLTEIEFADCYLIDLPTGIFKNLHLKLLSFFNCSFGKLSEDFGLDGVGSIETLVLYDNVYSNNIDIRPQLKVLEKEGTDIIFKSPLDPRDETIDEKLNQIFPND